MGIRTLVVANSFEVMQPVTDVIGSLSEFELLASCGDSFEALQWVAESRPDLLLLDIELPGMNGFELLEALGPAAPNVIFVGDSPEHALRAFEMEAIDLVRKPVTHERLHHALSRAKQFLHRANVELPPHQQHVGRLLLRCGARVVFLEPQEVVYIEANDNYVVFHTATECHTARMTMNQLEKTLRADLFIRIHRSTIVNLAHVRELRALAHGDYAVSLGGGVELTLSRSYRRQVHDLMPAWPL